ncbi:MAG: tRNA pseudouridine synthase [Bacteroidetes bacterium]|nr:tRNA pseudouridine synthase [Bacteroidota bacterium]
MARFKLSIEYEGTRYSGWQIQKNARTVQGELASALGSVLDTTDFELYGAGRTDAGVHALQQIAHLEAKTMLAPEILRRKINDELPADINVLGIKKAAPQFHARHDAVSRSYLYQISRRRTAFGKRLVWWIKDQLEADRMRAAAKLFAGLKDFRSFTADDPEEKSTKVHIEQIEIREARPGQGISRTAVRSTCEAYRTAIGFVPGARLLRGGQEARKPGSCDGS